MRVGKDGKTVRRQCERGVERAGKRLRRLLRQAVDEIDVDAGDAGGTDPRDGGGGILDRLQAVDRLLHVDVEILDAETHAVDADVPHRRHEFLVTEARIRLHGGFRATAPVEPRGQPLCHRDEVRRTQLRRRTAAPLNLADHHSRHGLGHEIDLFGERAGVGAKRFRTVHRRRVAGTVPAQARAEGHVEIDRRAVAAEVSEPCFVLHGTYGTVELGGRRIARIARDRPVVGRDGGGVHQCEISTGMVMLDRSVRLTPPSTISRTREWP